MVAGVARCHVGYILFLRQQFARALTELRAGVAALEALPPEAWAPATIPKGGVSIASVAEAGGLLAWTLTHVGAHDEALGLLGGTLAAAVAAIDTMGYYARLAVYQTATACGHPELARRVHERLRENVRSVEDSGALGFTMWGFLTKTALPYYADDLPYIAAIAGLGERARTQAQALQLAAPVPPARDRRSPLDFLGGAWDEVRASMVGKHYPLGRLLVGTIARLRGAPEEAWRELRAAFPAGVATEPGKQNLLDSLSFLHLGGLLLLDAGDRDGARQWAEASDRWLAWSGAVLGQSEGHIL